MTAKDCPPDKGYLYEQRFDETLGTHSRIHPPRTDGGGA